MKTRYGYSKINIIISITVVITCDLFYIAIIPRTPIIYLNKIKKKKIQQIIIYNLLPN